MTNKLYIFLTLSFVAVSVSAATPWPSDQKAAYIDRCATSMSSQGLAPKTASAYCSCIANGMSSEFGMEEYGKMMNGSPNPKGSDIDKRMFKLFSACQGVIPK